MKKERGKMLKDVVSNNKTKLHQMAEKNTVRNESGIPISKKDDPWREDEADSEQSFFYSSEEALV